MIGEFDGYMKQGYDLPKLLSEVEQDLKEIWKPSSGQDEFINQIYKFLISNIPSQQDSGN